MQVTEPNKIWWSVREIADATLPELPTAPKNIIAMAKRLRWQEQACMARKRQGRGGGWEYNWQLFPLAARKFLLAQVEQAITDDATPIMERNEAWQWFESLPEKAKQKAQNRLNIINQVAQLEMLDENKFTAVETVAQSAKVTSRTIWNWLSMIELVKPEDYLPYLAPRNKAAKRNDPKAKCSPEFIDRLKADFLRLEAPTFASSYRRVKRVCEANGWSVLAMRTAKRRIDELVPRVSQVFAREGVSGLQRCFPPQTRDKTGMVALEGVNADCHKIDAFVQWPDGSIDRPQIVAFQDLYSGKILSWRVDHTPNKVAVMSAFGDMIEEFGIPQRCLFDNGREFANKWLTGGTKTRFRYKIREDDPLGVLPQLGIHIHWAQPASGQSKPIERAFRDLADDIAKDPRFAGAYVGNRPDAKPENYMSHAVPIEQFLQVVADGIEEHNSREGRLSETANGRSFDQTFNESYAKNPIRKATEEQRRLWLMGQEIKTMHGSHGLVKIHDNEYFSDWMSEYAGQKIIARFDPEDLHAGLYIYALNGEFMGFAACKLKTGFFNLEDAQETARLRSKELRAQKRYLKTIRPVETNDFAAELDAVGKKPSEIVESKVVSAQFGKKAAAAQLVKKPEIKDTETPEQKAQHEAFIAEFPKQQKAKAKKQNTPEENFEKALEIMARSEAGKPVGEAEAKWLRSYQTTPEYRGHMMVHEDFKSRSS